MKICFIDVGARLFVLCVSSPRRTALVLYFADGSEGAPLWARSVPMESAVFAVPRVWALAFVRSAEIFARRSPSFFA